MAYICHANSKYLGMMLNFRGFVLVVFLFGGFFLNGQCPPPNPIGFEEVSCNPQSFTLSAINSTDTYNWYDAPVSGNLVFQGDYFTTPFLSTTTTYYVTSFYSPDNCESPRVPVRAVVLPEGNPSNFGINVWNVYCFDDLNWSNYKGSYIDANIDINTDILWSSNSSPTNESTYNGCPIAVDNHSISYKRQGFPNGIYRIEIVEHFDDFSLLINEVEVFSRVGDGQHYSAAWIGSLTSTSKVEFRWLDKGGKSSAYVRFISVANPTDLFAGTILDSQDVCLGGIINPVGDSISIVALKDAFVQAGVGALVTHGTNSMNELKVNNGIGDGNFRTILSFDISSISISNYKNAFLLLRGKSIGVYPDRVIQVFPVLDNSWDELTVTDNSCPVPSGTSIAESVIFDINDNWYYWDISTYIKSELNNGNTRVSFILSTNENVDLPVSFYSKEGGFAPQIIINKRNGGCSSYNYAWEMSTNCNNLWTPVLNANDFMFQPTSNFGRNCYRLRVSDGCSNVQFSNVVEVNYHDLAIGGNLEYSGPFATLSEYSGLITEWQVSTDDFTTAPAIYLSSDPTFNIIPDPNMDFYIRVLVKSGNCFFSYSDTLIISHSTSLNVINSFTPNNDGINDNWIIRGIEKKTKNHVVVVNIFGETVFDEHDYDNQNVVWNGRNRKGDFLPEGTYFYDITLDEGKVLKGFVVIKK